MVQGHSEIDSEVLVERARGKKENSLDELEEVVNAEGNDRYGISRHGQL